MCSGRDGFEWLLPNLRKVGAMPVGEEVFIGLNQNGLIVFIILIIVCLPLCWIPFLIDSLKGNPK